MSRRRLDALVPALVVLACVDRPALTTDDPPASSSGEATTDLPTGTNPTDTATGTSTTDPPDPTATTSTTTGTTTGTTSTDTGDATTGDPPPAGCVPCDRTFWHDGNLDIWPVTDLSQFGCMVGVHGHLTITGDLSAEQLAPLCHLSKVDGWLSIRTNALLTDLSPFASLEEALVLELRELPALTAVAGLTSLRDLLQLRIDETGATTLGSFAPEFTGIDSLWISSNPALTDLSALVGWGLKGTTQFIRLFDNAAITDLTDLSDLFAAAGPGFVFELADMPGLTSLAGLGAASAGHYDLSRLPLVTDLSPLATVKTLDALRLREIPLTTLSGLGALQSAALGLHDMPHLTSLDGLGPLADGGVDLGHLSQLGSLKGLESFKTGSVVLVDLPLVDSLAPLSALTQGEWIILQDLPLVTSLVGLHNLQSADMLSIGDCVNEGTGGMDGLTDLTGLGALTTAGELMITNSANVKSLAGADSLGVVVDRLALINDPGLTQAAVDAFLAQVDEPEMTCFGDWGVCDCIEIMPP